MTLTNLIPLTAPTHRADSRESEPVGVPVCPYFDIKRDRDGKEYIETAIRGIALMRLVLTNKGTAFSRDERVALGLDGLLPTQICTLEEQIERAYRSFRQQPTPIAQYQFLRGVQERQEILFYALVSRHLDEMLPIIYTPTVGEAVANFSALFQTPRGLSLGPHNIDRIDAILAEYPLNDIRLIVATDSSAILGIGDQGYGGLAISIGKLALYTVGGGVSPFHTMPVCLDVGTERSDLVTDPLYLGARQRRLRGEEYLRFVDRFVDGVRRRWPHAVIQWEDLSKDAAFTVLERYRNIVPSFNDDIQGTGAVALAGALAACRRRGETLADHRFLVYGAGAGGIGVAKALRDGLVRGGLSAEEAAERLYVLDSQGLLLDDRELPPYKQAFARSADSIRDWEAAGSAPDLLETVRQGKVTALIGLSGQPGAFTRTIIEAVAANAPHPIVFPLSNPTSLTEAQPQDIVEWTEARAAVATGSPFGAVAYEDRIYHIGQGNNAFVFPGLGFGTVLAGAMSVSDGMVLAAAYALADYTAEKHLDAGRIYPPVNELAEVSVRVAKAVIVQANKEGLATRAVPVRDVEKAVRERFWKPRYLPIVAG